eukprot:5900174-Karenia_brevis.AAC.1
MVHRNQLQAEVVEHGVAGSLEAEAYRRFQALPDDQADEALQILQACFRKINLESIVCALGDAMEISETSSSSNAAASDESKTAVPVEGDEVHETPMKSRRIMSKCSFEEVSSRQKNRIPMMIR